MDLGRGWLPPPRAEADRPRSRMDRHSGGRGGRGCCCAAKEKPEEKRPGIVQLVSLAACQRSRLSDFLLDFRRLGRQTPAINGLAGSPR